MVKNRVILLLVLLLLAPLISAQSNPSDSVSPQTDALAKAYQCLEDQVDSKDSSILSLQESVFGVLALGSNSKLSQKIDSLKSSTEDCWPSSGCTIKETAQVLIAYDRVNKNTANIEKWLSSKNTSTTNLDWFLQIDVPSKQQSQCTLSYDGGQHQVTIGADLKISGSPGPCFSISPSGFWLRMNNNCFEKEIRVSCNNDFVTSLVYQKAGSSTIYISPETHSAPSLGTTTEKVSSKCYRTGSTCDYEGTLWATLAMSKEGKDVTPFIPYLLVFAEDNEKFLPSSFIYSLTKGDDQYSKLVQSQKQNQFWEAPATPYNRFYDTALALWALQGVSAPEVSNAQNYLLSVQSQEGCWDNNNLRNTAFILYASWPKAVSGSSGSGTIESCEGASPQFSCTSAFACGDLGGDILGNYACTGAGQVCCSQKAEIQSCSALGGQLCSSGTVCPSGGSVQSSDFGTCCISACQPEQVAPTNVCEQQGIGVCAFSCGSGQEQTFDSCGVPSLVCCAAPSSSGGSALWIIILLIILIAIAVLAIIYRRQLQLWWFNFRSKRKGKGPSSPSSPRGPSYPPVRPPVNPARPIQPRVFAPPVRQPMQQRPRPVSNDDKELEETLKKLREMSR